MFTLEDGPDVPDHVMLDRSGIPYVAEVQASEADLPARFTGPPRPQDATGPPWATLVFGLETARHDMRDRFVAELRADLAAGRSIERYGDAVSAAFHHLFGGRGATADAPGFQAFLRHTIATEPDPAARAQLERGLHELVPAAVDPRIARVGASAVTFAAETGHVPADHVSVLYWMSALVPGWEHAHFDQIPSESEDIDPDNPHSLLAWWAGNAYRAPAENRGDFVDPWSCAGLVNVILRDVAKADIRVHVLVDDEHVRAIGGTRRVLAGLRDELAPTHP